MRIVFSGVVTSPLWKGGEPKTVREIAKILSTKGTTVYFSNAGTSKGLRGLRSFPYASGLDLKPSAFLNYLAKLRKIKPDLLFAWFDFDSSAIQAARFLRIPYVVSARIYWPICQRNTLWNPIYNDISPEPLKRCGECILHGSKLASSLGKYFNLSIRATMARRAKLLRESQAILVNSEFLKRTLIQHRYPSEKIKVVRTPVDTSRFRPVEPKNENGKTVLYVSDSAEQFKGFGHFVMLAKRLATKHRSVDFLALGPMPPVKDGIRCQGRVSEVKLVQFYQSCYLVIVPSLWNEPFGRVAVEAMACGKPVVAYAVGGLTEIVKDGETGFLVPRSNIGQLTTRVEAILNDEDMALRFGQNGRVMAERLFSLEAVTKPLCDALSLPS